MSFIPINLNEAEEAKPVSNGRYDVTIAQVEETLTKESQKPMLRVMIAIDGHDDAPNIFEYVPIPETAKEFKALVLRRFLTLFGYKISSEGIDPELLVMELPGYRANVELVQQEYNGNISNKLIVPRLKGEESPGAGRGTPPRVQKRA